MDDIPSKAPYSPKSKVAYADPGYRADKKARYPIDNLKHAVSSWSYVNETVNAKAYTPNQLKRVRQRIAKALTKFGAELDAQEHWVITTGEVTETTPVVEYFDNPDSAGCYYISVTNGPTTVTVSSSCIDPADLELIGRAAMDGATAALKAIDPDMDGDIDVPGADDEDTDHDMGSAGETVESTQDTATEAETEDPAPEPAADHEEEEDLVADETTTPAVEPSADATPEPNGLDTLSAKFDALTSAIAGMVEKLTPAPAAVAAESAPEPKTEVKTEESAPAAPEVTESAEDRIARLVAEGVAKALPQAIQEHVETNGVQRKGLVKGVTEAATAPAQTEYPEGWPVHPQTGIHKAMHEMSREEFNAVSGPALAQLVFGNRAAE